jgi:glycosyltransferase involved in cell wall biosynthesis
LVSVIIPSYNSEATIEATLRSVLAQDFEEDYEVIVSDSSTDETPALIRREFPSVHLLHRQRRMQSGTARNLGIGAAQGQILAFTDADCIVPPCWLRRLVGHHRRHPDYAAVGGSIANGNPDSLVSWTGYLAEFNIHLPEESDPHPSNHIPTSNISYKRWVFERYGGFPGDEVIKHVDLLFNRTLRVNGERLLCDPAIPVAHFHRTELDAYLRHQRDIGRGTVQAMRRLSSIQGAWLARHPPLGTALLPIVTLVKFLRNSARFIAWSPEVVWRRPSILPLFALGLGWWGIGFARELLHGERSQDPEKEDRDLSPEELLSTQTFLSGRPICEKAER